MHRLKHIKWLPLLMVLSILAIAAFQYYWLQKAYDREERSLERQTNMLFRETVISMQASKLKLDRIADSSKTSRVYLRNEGMKGAKRSMDPKMVNMMNAMLEKVRDTTKGTVILRGSSDTLRIATNMSGQRERVMQFLFDVDSAQDSIRLSELDSAYARRLDEQNLDVPFT